MRRVVVVLCLLLLHGPAHADEVVLHSGGKLSCEVLEVTDTIVRIRLPRGVMEIPRAKVLEIRRESKRAYLEREASRSQRTGSERGAVELYERAFREAQDDESIQAKYEAALEVYATSLVREFRFREAERAIRTLVRIHPNHPSAKRLADAMAREITRTGVLLDRAERSLKSGNVEVALRELEAWRQRRPVDDPHARKTMASAYLLAGRHAASQTRLRAALDHYRAAVAFGAHGEAQQALYLLRPIAVLEAMREGDLEHARRELRGIATTYPHPATPVYLEAVLSHVSGNVEHAVQRYADAARLAEKTGPKRAGVSYKLAQQYASATLRAAIARPPSEGVSRWRELFLGSLVRYDEGRHFTVYAPSADVAAKLSKSSDAAYDRIANELLGRLPKTGKAELVIHPSRRAYVAADPSPPGTPLKDASVSREQTAGVCYDTLDENGERLVRVETFAHSDWEESTIPHELVHVVQRRGLPAFRRGKWLDEGLAMLYESTASQTNRLALWRRLAKGRMPLPEFLALRSIPAERVSMFYSQAHAFTVFLRSLGDGAQWTRFLSEFGNSEFEVAVRRVYQVESVAVLERLWLSKAGR